MCTTAPDLSVILVALFFGSFSATASVCATQVPDVEERASICSVFGVVLANAEAMHQGDVLVVDRRFYDGTEESESGIVLQQTTYRRLVFDADQGKHLIMTRTVFDWLELELERPDSPKRTVKTVDRQRLVDFNTKTHYYRSGNAILEIPEPEPFAPLGIYSDPRTAGTFSNALAPLEHLHRRWDRLLTGDGLLEHVRGAETLELKLLIQRDEERGTSAIGRYFFDNRTNLPEKSSWYVEFDKGGTTKSHEKTFEWAEHGDLHTCVRVAWFTPDSFIGPDHVERDGRVSAEMRLHWFSVNEPIADELFQSDILLNDEKFRDLIDPVRSGADSLMEFDKAPGDVLDLGQSNRTPGP